MRRNKVFGALVGTAMFFVLIAAVVTVAVVIYAVLEGVTGGNKTVIACVMLLVILFLSVLCTVIDLIRRHIVSQKPLNEILEAADKIAKGNFMVRLEIKHNFSHYDDYDFIKENLNKMAEELSRTEVLHTDFIANVSHEIKTPLVAIQNYSSYLRNGKLSGEDRAKYASLLMSATVRLTALVTNILKLNKLENQRIIPDYESVNLSQALAEAVIDYEELIENKNLALDCDIEENVIIKCPSGYPELVFNNLVSNAVKFTDTGGIMVRLICDGENAKITVADTGCGISPQAGAHIFEKFYQGDVSRSQEGNGLGLALVQKVIDVIGGEISVESEPGKGTAFTVIFKTEG